MWSNAFHYVWLCQDVVHTAKNSLLSTISFPSASNMLNAILKPAWGSEVRQKSTTSSPFILLTNQILIIIIDTFCQRSVQIYTYLLKCRAGRGTLCNLGHLKKNTQKEAIQAEKQKPKCSLFRTRRHQTALTRRCLQMFKVVRPRWTSYPKKQCTPSDKSNLLAPTDNILKGAFYFMLGVPLTQTLALQLSCPSGHKPKQI